MPQGNPEDNDLGESDKMEYPPVPPHRNTPTAVAARVTTSRAKVAQVQSTLQPLGRTLRPFPWRRRTRARRKYSVDVCVFTHVDLIDLQISGQRHGHFLRNGPSTDKLDRDCQYR